VRGFPKGFFKKASHNGTADTAEKRAQQNLSTHLTVVRVGS